MYHKKYIKYKNKYSSLLKDYKGGGSKHYKLPSSIVVDEDELDELDELSPKDVGSKHYILSPSVVQDDLDELSSLDESLEDILPIQPKHSLFPQVSTHTPKTKAQFKAEAEAKAKARKLKATCKKICKC
jgi:hypothetical protein